MKKFAFFSLVVSFGFALTGCIVTDYNTTDLAAMKAQHNLSHGLIDAVSSDRKANTQQTLEAVTRDMLRTTSYGGCTGFNPSTGIDFVDRASAKEMNRFIGAWSFQLELSTTGNPPGLNGTFVNSGVKVATLDGVEGVRINNYFAPSGPSMACPFSSVGCSTNGRYGGPEGVVAGDWYDGGKFDVVTQGGGLDNIAFDTNGTSFDFCDNFWALSPERAAAGMSTQAGATRVGEGLLHNTPIVGAAGLAEFFAGEALSVSHAGFDVTLSGGVREDGMVVVSLHDVTYNGSSFFASTPIEGVVSRDMKRFEFNSDQPAVRDLVQWALNNNIAMDEPMDIGGFVPELGVELPSYSLRIGREPLENFLAWSDADQGTGTRRR